MNGCDEVDTIRDAVEKALQKCDVCMAGNIISRERLLRAYSDFVLSTMEKEKHNVGMILHTGSACFDVLLIVCAALSNILYNQTATDDVIARLRLAIKSYIIVERKKQERKDIHFAVLLILMMIRRQIK